MAVRACTETECEGGQLTYRLAKRFKYNFPDNIFSVIVRNCEVDVCNKCSYRHLSFDDMQDQMAFTLAAMKEMAQLPFVLSGARWQFLGNFLINLLDQDAKLAHYVGFSGFSRMQDLELTFNEAYLEDEGENDMQKERGSAAKSFWQDAKAAFADRLGLNVEQLDDFCNYKRLPQRLDRAIKMATFEADDPGWYPGFTESIGGVYVTIMDGGCFPHIIT